MNVWLFGKEIECFKPLRHVLDSNILNQIDISEELLNIGWNRKDILELIAYKGFIDPKYPSRIRTGEKIITIEGFTITEIKNFNPTKENNSIKRMNITHFKDFSKNKPINIHYSLKKHEWINSKWIEEDLNVESIFLGKEGIDRYIFQTEYFKYIITDNISLVEIKWKDTNEDILNIIWIEEGFIIKTNSKNISIYNNYSKWLSYIALNNQLTWRITKEINESKASYYLEQFKDKLIIHPSIWKNFKVKREEEKNFYLNLWQNDWTYNGLILRQDEILGWRFKYIFDGLILKEVLLPNEDAISMVEYNEEYLIINDKRTSLLKHKPSNIYDLIEGNLIKILTRDTIFNLELHSHAILRYEQRVDNNSYLCNMFSHILTDIYNNGYVVEGAHKENRKKVYTETYGYVINDTYVISVWDRIHKGKKLPKKKNNKYNKPSKKMKHLEKMTKLFEQINNT